MKITGFGEILWDAFPDGKILGGAPLNVLYRLQSLGMDTAIISSRGNDGDGEELVRQIQQKNIVSDFIQIHPDYPTSQVKVSLNAQGSASYEIVHPCAWDGIRTEEAALHRVAQSDAFIFGSLTMRDETSRKTLNNLLQQAKFKIFDVNLRKPHYDASLILETMKQADVVKLNDDELYELSKIYGSPYHGLEQNIVYLAKLTDTDTLCVTLGSHGAVLYKNGEFFRHGGFKIEVADTVGSGDSFLGGLIYQLLNRAEPQYALAFACALGALVASEHGATPEISPERIGRFMNPV